MELLTGMINKASQLPGVRINRTQFWENEFAKEKKAYPVSKEK